MDDADVLRLLKEQCAAAGGQEKWAIQNSVSATSVSVVLQRHYPPTPAILTALGLRKVFSYEPVGDDE